jgi:hypothetical protein
VVAPAAAGQPGRPARRGNERPPSIDAGSVDVAAEVREAPPLPPAEPARAGSRPPTVPRAATPRQLGPVTSSPLADYRPGQHDRAVRPTSEPARLAPLKPGTPRPGGPDRGASPAAETGAKKTGTARGAHRHDHRGRRPSNRSGYVRFGAVAVVVATVGLVGWSRWAPHHRSRLAVPASRPAAPLPVPPSPQPATTTTTPAAAVLISGDRNGARYQVPPSATIEVVTSSPCWLQVRTASVAGPILFQGVLGPGDRKPLPNSGPLWLRLGNQAGVAVIVNSHLLHLAGSSSGQPYNVELQPAA